MLALRPLNLGKSFPNLGPPFASCKLGLPSPGLSSGVLAQAMGLETLGAPSGGPRDRRELA